MNEFKGTPGPWEAVGEDLDDFRVRAVAGNKRGPGYAVERTVCEEIRKREDALLIAAAPELLAALQEIYRHGIQAFGEDFEVMLEAKSAIDKATSNSN